MPDKTKMMNSEKILMLVIFLIILVAGLWFPDRMNTVQQSILALFGVAYHILRTDKKHKDVIEYTYTNAIGYETYNEDKSDPDDEDDDFDEFYDEEDDEQPEHSRFDDVPAVKAYVTRSDIDGVDMDLPEPVRSKLIEVTGAWDIIHGAGRRDWMEGDGAAFVVQSPEQVSELTDYARYYGGSLQGVESLQENPLLDGWLCARYVLNGFTAFVIVHADEKILGKELLETWQRHVDG